MWHLGWVGAVGVGALVSPVIRHVVTRLTGTRRRLWPVAAWSAAGVAVAACAADPVSAVLAGTLVPIGVALGFVDADRRLLPDALVLPAYPLCAAVLIVAAVATGDGDAALRAAGTATACAAWYGLGCATGGLGFGDVKLGGLLGLALGWAGVVEVVAAVVLAALLGAVWSLVSVVRTGTRVVAFGPPMLIAALSVVAAS